MKDHINIGGYSILGPSTTNTGTIAIQPQFSGPECAKAHFESSCKTQNHPYTFLDDRPKTYTDSKPPLLRKGGLLTRHFTVPGGGLKPTTPRRGGVVGFNPTTWYRGMEGVPWFSSD